MHGIALIRAQRGLISWLAPHLHLTQAAVSMWQRIPAERVPEIETLTGIPRHLLRPDLWTPPWRGGEKVPQKPKIKKRSNNSIVA